MSISIGIDPGFGGAIAIIENSRLIATMCMPLKPQSQLFEQKTRSEIDAAKLTSVLVPYIFSESTIVTVERVNSSPQMGVVSSFRFGEGFGTIIGVLSALDLKVKLAYPAVWKRELGLSSNKSESRALANELFPEWSAEFGLKKSADIAEAALLAHYGQRFFLR